MPTITVRFSDFETIAAIGYLRGPPDDPTRAQPTAAAAVRKAILFAADRARGAPPSPPPETAPALAPLLNVWAALCTERGRAALTTHEVTERPSAALEVALTAIGYPLACRSARALGQTLRHLARRPCPDGRMLCCARGVGEGGRMLWRVAAPAPAPAP